MMTMNMIQSNFNNLFSYIFPDESQSASLVIKFLLVLESENLIPLFLMDDDKNINHGISGLVTNHENKILSVSNILKKSLGKNQSSLFFGSNFQVESFSNTSLETKIFDTFLIFSLEGLILDYPLFLSNQSQYKCDEKYDLIPWDYWDHVFISFVDDEPKCSLIFSKNNGEYITINNICNSDSEANIIEQQLPLIFCYFIMKRFWQYVQKSRHESFYTFNSQDFLYLDKNNLSYFTQNILANINITPDDLDNLVRKIEL